MSAKPGHGDHWLAAAEPGDPRLLDALAPPLDASAGVAVHRARFSEAVDLVQVTARRRLVTAYPEPRAAAGVEGRPRRLDLWETRVEGWLTFEHEGAGALTAFLTDLAGSPERYQRAGPRATLDVAGLAYSIGVGSDRRDARLAPAARLDDRFLPDDYVFEADVHGVRPAGDARVLDVSFQGGLRFPLTARHADAVRPGDRVEGLLWLTARWPAEAGGALGKGL